MPRWLLLVLLGALVLVTASLAGLGLYRFATGGPSSRDCELSCTEWTPCDDCGGNQTRTCVPSVLPLGDGAPCPPLFQVQACPPAPGCPATDCVPGAPSANGWSGCPACVAPGEAPPSEWQFVPPAVAATNGGKQCQWTDLLVTRTCAIPTCRDADCVISQQPIVTDCSKPCGGGTQIATYELLSPPVGTGSCDWAQLFPTVQACNTQDCPSPTNCAGVQWSGPWSNCDAACGPGVQYQARLPDSPYDDCPLVRVQACNLGTCTAFPGETCTAPTPDQVAARCFEACVTPGLPAPTSAWEDNGVYFCGVSLSAMQQICGVTDLAVGSCPAPQDCQLSDWSDWGSCSMDCDANYPTGGSQYRSRTIVKEAVGGGTPCSEYQLVEEQPCNNLVPVTGPDGTSFPAQCNPVPCQLSAWSPVGPCTVPCGGGVQYSVRTVSQLPSGGGTPCPFTPSEYYSTVSCNTAPCGNCVYESWDAYIQREGWDWGPCNSTCNGQMTMGPRAIVTPAQPGGSCDPGQAFSVTSCCPNCVCDACPVGPNGLECSGPGHGTCSVDLQTGSAACQCQPGFFGSNCWHDCPIGLNGQVCSGYGACDDTTDGTCNCVPNVSGAYCDQAPFYQVSYSAWFQGVATQSGSFCLGSALISQFGGLAVLPTPGETVHLLGDAIGGDFIVGAFTGGVVSQTCPTTGPSGPNGNNLTLLLASVAANPQVLARYDARAQAFVKMMARFFGIPFQ